MIKTWEEVEKFWGSFEKENNMIEFR